jgi:hypothetical protein
MLVYVNTYLKVTLQISRDETLEVFLKSHHHPLTSRPFSLYFLLIGTLYQIAHKVYIR